MTIRASKFTPEVMISLPRRQNGVPNSDGSYILYVTSTYSFDKHEKTGQIRLLDVKKNESTVVLDDKSASDPVWINDKWIAMFKGSEEGTDLLVGQVENFAKNHAVVKGIVGPASNLKVVQLEGNRYGVAFSAQANPDGSMYNPSKAPKKLTTGKLYSSLFVRHWDAWRTPQYNSLWYTSLEVVAYSPGSGLCQCSTAEFVNALQDSGLSSPIEPFGGADHFDLAPRGIVFVAKDPSVDPATHTKCGVYLALTGGFESKATISRISDGVVALEETFGAATSPVFSSDGKQVAFLQMDKDGYESDQNRLFVIPNIQRPLELKRIRLTTKGSHEEWQFSPASVVFSADGKSLFLNTEIFGQNQVFQIQNPADIQGNTVELVQLPSVAGSPADLRPLGNGDLFLTSNSIIDNSTYSVISPGKTKALQISSLTHDGSTIGLSPKQIDSIWTPASGKNAATGDKVHSWVIKPSNFDSSKKYPLALLIHGGPQGAWKNAWSTRWNPAVFAEQGYVVVLPNPTGSTGYSQPFTDAIAHHWGSLPYDDIVNCFDYVEKNLGYVDISRAVAAGASYGGYMVNWIQGHDLGRRLKALVTHDGLFAFQMALATEELYFMNHDLGGNWLDPAVRPTWEQWNPAQFVQNWNTPHLIIHSELDYRITMADGLGAFNILQQKGVPSQFLTFSDENHFVAKPENSIMWHRAVFSWLNKHAGLPPYEEEDLSEIVMDPSTGLDGAMAKTSIS